MSKLADDPKTLCMMGEATFRQKGEAFYRQLRMNWIPPWMYMAMQAQNIYGTAMWRQQYGMGQVAGPVSTNIFQCFLGSIGEIG